MLTAIEGIYQDGWITLSETPEGVEGRRVLAAFLENKMGEENGTDNSSGQAAPGRMITFGMFAGPVETTEDDFRMAEFRGDPDDELDWA